MMVAAGVIFPAVGLLNHGVTVSVVTTGGRS